MTRDEVRTITRGQLMNCFNEPGEYPRNIRWEMIRERFTLKAHTTGMQKKYWKGKSPGGRKASIKKLYVKMIWSSWDILVALDSVTGMAEKNGLQKHWKKVEQIEPTEYLKGWDWKKKESNWYTEMILGKTEKSFRGRNEMGF